jgi:type IV secretory pathway VirJ component
MRKSYKFKILLLFFLALVQGCNNSKENPDFPVRELDAQNNTPFIFYVSGDAGFNTFSKSLSDELFKRNYDITALDSKAYFWKPKTPDETAKKISLYLNAKLKGRKNQQIVILGYSFGSDISAFIVNRLPKSLKEKIVSVILLDPSKTADFEVSLQGMIFDKGRGKYKVLPEINKMKVPKTMIIRSDIGMRFPIDKVNIQNFSTDHLPGNHRFNYNYKKIADLINQNIKSK